MKKVNFKTLDYLKHGTTVQQKIYKLLHDHQIMKLLHAYDPVLIGTYPIDIAVDNSDLDIACFFKDKNHFLETIKESFGHYPNFNCTAKVKSKIQTVVASFLLEDFPVELFGQDRPVEQQDGYRHMLKEYEILANKGAIFKSNVIHLKRKGVKTEPAFAHLLQLEGDPYQAILDYQLE
ncbi:DUF4269 domain-containing protein [Myroides injenensis]|uniref:DUF4269 domain-containing protein n=1 Tax=Myroides injenensis TaxID=1183151 RepID=UPI0002897810|nr:DUF4269 domain-containing protein [Myroides injenensis]